MHWAALAGQNEIITYLLEQGASPNEHSKNDYGPCPIHWACVHGHVITVDLLLEQGVPIDMTDFNRCSPLTIAAQYGQSLCVSYLLQKGANKFHVDINGDSTLHWAAFKGTSVRVLSIYTFIPAALLIQVFVACSTNAREYFIMWTGYLGIKQTVVF